MLEDLQTASGALNETLTLILAISALIFAIISFIYRYTILLVVRIIISIYKSRQSSKIKMGLDARSRAKTVSQNLRESLLEAADYFDRAYKLAERIEDIVGESGLKQFPVKIWTELGKFPRPDIFFEDKDEALFDEAIRGLIGEQRAAIRAWSGILDQIVSKHPSERVDLEHFITMKNYFIKRRKSARQAEIVLRINETFDFLMQ